MKKLVLDSNIIDYCLELALTKDFFDSLNVEIYVPTYVKNEILNSNKQSLIDKLSEIEYKQIGFFGFSDDINALGFDEGIFYELEYDKFIESTKHKNDRFIALLSKINDAIFITSDNKIFKDAVKYNVNSIFLANDNKSYDNAMLYSQYVYNKLNLTKKDFEEALKIQVR